MFLVFSYNHQPFPGNPIHQSIRECTDHFQQRQPRGFDRIRRGRPTNVDVYEHATIPSQSSKSTEQFTVVGFGYEYHRVKQNFF